MQYVIDYCFQINALGWTAYSQNNSFCEFFLFFFGGGGGGKGGKAKWSWKIENRHSLNVIR